MTYKSKDKSFFDEVFEKKEIEKAIEDKKDDLDALEKKGARKFLKLYDFGSSKLRADIKKKPGQYFFLFVTSFLGSVITTGAALIIFSGNLVAQFVSKPTSEVKSVQVIDVSKEIRIQKYDPLLLSSKLRKKEVGITIIDIRSKEDFDKGHILTALSLPIYGTTLVDKNGDVDEGEIKKLLGTYLKSGELIIVYGQNAYSTIPIDIVALVNDRFPNIKPLAIGWEEWVHLNK